MKDGIKELESYYERERERYRKSMPQPKRRAAARKTKLAPQRVERAARPEATPKVKEPTASSTADFMKLREVELHRED